MKKGRFLTFFFGLLLAGCTFSNQPGSIDCDVITAAPLRTLVQAEILSFDPIQWIAQTFGLDASAISSSYGSAGASFNWDIEGVRYDLDISADNKPEALIHFDRAKPTAGQMLECLGPPERYRARYFFHPPGVNSLIFEIYYPSQGLTANYTYQTMNLKRRRPPAITVNTPIDRIWVDPPGVSSEEYMERTAKTVINETKPWPGSWEQIEIDLGPFLESN